MSATRTVGVTPGRSSGEDPSLSAEAGRRKVLAALVGFEALLVFVPLLMLGGAIGWPGSLDDPSDVALSRLLENEGAVRLGYLAYLAYSIVFLPVAVIVYRWVREQTAGGRLTPAVTVSMQIAVGMASASALARSIGIVRWLSTMLPMAERWESAGAAERSIIAEQFTALNDYGGTIGEILGVSIFASIWLAVTVLAPGVTRRWVRVSGVVTAILLALPAIELAGIDAGPVVSVSSTAITVWLAVVAIAMYRSAPRAAVS